VQQGVFRGINSLKTPMRKIYTDDLIRFIYNETTIEQNKFICLSLQSNPTLKSECELLKESIHQLDAISLLPHPSSIKIIMEESFKQSAEMAH
jgi:hypothetical protein